MPKLTLVLLISCRRFRLPALTCEVPVVVTVSELERFTYKMVGA